LNGCGEGRSQNGWKWSERWKRRSQTVRGRAEEEEGVRLFRGCRPAFIITAFLLVARLQMHSSFRGTETPSQMMITRVAKSSNFQQSQSGRRSGSDLFASTSTTACDRHRPPQPPPHKRTAIRGAHHGICLATRGRGMGGRNTPHSVNDLDRRFNQLRIVMRA
jgi:hypothetical protein